MLNTSSILEKRTGSIIRTEGLEHHTHSRDDFPYHSVPANALVPLAAVLAIWHNVQLIAEANPGRQLLDQVHTVT